jgi:hypothetical protein
LFFSQKQHKVIYIFQIFTNDTKQNVLYWLEERFNLLTTPLWLSFISTPRPSNYSFENDGHGQNSCFLFPTFCGTCSLW